MAHCLGWKHEVATHISGLLQMCNAMLLEVMLPVMWRLMALRWSPLDSQPGKG